MKNLIYILIFLLLTIITSCNFVNEPLWTDVFNRNGLPPKIEYADTNIVVVSYIDSLYCINSKTGKTMFVSEFEFFSKVYFDNYLYFFKRDNLFVKINPFTPDEKWELLSKYTSLNRRSISKNNSKIYLDTYYDVWEVNADSLQLIMKHPYSIDNEFKKHTYVQRIYADNENIFYTINHKLCLHSIKDTVKKILIDSIPGINDFMFKKNNSGSYSILEYTFGNSFKRIYKFEKDKKLKCIHEDKWDGGKAVSGFDENDKTIAYQSGDWEHVIVYSLETESILLKYPFSRRIGNVKVYNDLLIISEIVEGHDYNRSTFHFIDIKSGERIRKIKFDHLVYDFEIAGNKIYYAMDNKVSCSEL